MYNNSEAEDDNIYIGSFISFKILRVLLIIVLAIILICAAVAFDVGTALTFGSDYLSTRIALIGISTAALAVSLVILLLAFLYALEYFVTVLADIFFAFLILIVSIIAIVREAQISSFGYGNIVGYNSASFALAGAFGLIALILYLLSIAIARIEAYRDDSDDYNGGDGFGSGFRTYGRNFY